jgi:predicted AAA+ superfamily ATPase
VRSLSKTYYDRIIELKLPKQQSAFLWGARKTGKSTYLRHQFAEAIYIDLLEHETFWELSKNPTQFRNEILAATQDRPQACVIVDEVQKIPALLDEIHALIEKTELQFILCGSSARKLRRQGVNLLGGRAWKYYCLPLTSQELPDMDLLKIFQRGTLAPHWLSTQPQRSLQAYVEDYLYHEIQAEGLVRNLPSFARFLDSMRFCNGELINYSNIARDCHIDGKTVKELVQQSFCKLGLSWAAC